MWRKLSSFQIERRESGILTAWAPVSQIRRRTGHKVSQLPLEQIYRAPLTCSPE